MKKMSIALLAMLLLVGCSQAETAKDEQQTSSAEATVQETEKEDSVVAEEDAGYVFNYNGTSIGMHQLAHPIMEEIGEPNSMFEADSCAYEGKDRVYNYGSFELYTYEKDGEEYVLSIYLLDDSIGTLEGVYLYDTLESVIAAYGEDYEESIGFYTYEQGDTSIVFLVQDEEVKTIEYVALLN